jgi:hypothetical protein
MVNFHEQKQIANILNDELNGESLKRKLVVGLRKMRFGIGIRKEI